MSSLTSFQKKIVVIVVLIILILAGYWQVQDFEFVNYDDTIYVTQNFKTQTGMTWANIKGTFTDFSMANWHPLTMLSHMMDWQLFGVKAGGHHWSSLIIHIFNTVLLFLLLNSLTGSVWRSATVAALFAIHPINVESVAWIAERKNVLSTFFWMLTMMFYVRYVKRPVWERYLPVLLCFALGLMSKPMLVTLPFTLLLLDYWPLHRTYFNTLGEGPEKSCEIKGMKQKVSFLIAEKIPLFVLSIVFSCITLYAQHNDGTLSDLDMVPITDRISNAIVSYSLYIKKLLWPMDLAVLYPLEHIPIWQVTFAGLFLLIVTTLVIKYVRKYPFMAVGWLWYMGTLIPVIGIVQAGVQSMADRYAYVPFIGLFVLIVWGLFSVSARKCSKKLLLVTIAAGIIGLTTMTYGQIQYWENNYTLYHRALEVAKPNYIPHKNLGIHLINQNRPEEAVQHLRKAMEFKKNDPTLYNSMGVALLMMNDSSGAEKAFKTALTFNPNNARAHNNLGMALMNQGNFDEALKHFQEAVKLEPLFANAHYRLSIIFKQKGISDKALYHYHEAIRINPRFSEMK
ncbi:MAG: hypothetical protein CVU71_00900 [Deltaproteobacteria bacterium HGW-Deltaproteobacteria-6]|jgi:cytochrome c-type biogenesis protein CcmH/NrfG|nr:MAG: hypothetical protein CVU71_00900 [Deltaproteobacteria bacterium HGW-Deltaproteobacteria-6]